MDLQETKFKDLNNQKKTETIKDQQKAVYSQGYEMSEPTKVPRQGSHFRVDLTHRKTGEKVKQPDGRDIGGAREKSGALDNSLRNTTAAAIKAHARKIGRVDKTPGAVKKRKAEANKNIRDKMARQAKQSKSPRNMEKVKPRTRLTFEEWMMNCNDSLTQD